LCCSRIAQQRDHLWERDRVTHSYGSRCRKDIDRVGEGADREFLVDKVGEFYVIEEEGENAQR